MVRCQDCGHYYADPVLEPKLIENAYALQGHDNEFGQDESVLAATNRRYVKQLARYLPAHRDLLVDIGCDTGKFLEATLDLKFAQYVGIEPSACSVGRGKKLPQNVKILNDFFRPQAFAPQSIDVVSMIHVLDHLPNPLEFVGNLVPLLKPEGLVFTVVHNIRSFVAFISGGEWHPYNLIHYDYYSKKSLRALFEKAGYNVLAVTNTVNIMTLDQALLRAPYLGKSLRNRLHRTFKNSPLGGVEFRLPLGNIAIVAQPKGQPCN